MYGLLLTTSIETGTVRLGGLIADVMPFLMTAGVITFLYLFGLQFQKILAKIFAKFNDRVGGFTNSKEYHVRRYIYLHRNSLTAKGYYWINEQLIAMGLRRQGVTPVGYLVFWTMVVIIMTICSGFFMGLKISNMLAMSVMLLFVILVLTRVLVSGRIEKREMDVMNAIDLIVPELNNGVKNAIVTYRKNFDAGVREDFEAFIDNIQSRGFSFEDSMNQLSESLGVVFRDFADKAIYYETIGEKEMLDIFTDITETNRLRRQMREENTEAFASLKGSFIASSCMSFGYLAFILYTDAFSRHFFLQTGAGKVILVIIAFIVFSVLAYISTIKSKAI